MLLAGLITGILLYVIGSIMERNEKARREREWHERRDRWGK